MPMERSQHKVAAGVGTGAWPGDTLREQEAPKPVLWKEEQKRRTPDTPRCQGGLRKHHRPKNNDDPLGAWGELGIS